MSVKGKAGQKPDKPGPFAVAKHGSVVVPIYRTKVRNGVSFVVVWRDGKKRLRKAFASIEAAEAHGAEIARSLAKFGTSSLTLTGEELLAYRRATDTLRPFGISVDDAVAEYAGARRKLGNVRLPDAIDRFLRAPGSNVRDCPIMKDLVTEFLEAKESAGRSFDHLRDVKSRLRKFERSVPGRLSDVHMLDVEQWARSFAVGPRTRRNYLGAVTNLVRYAERRGYLAKGALDLSGIERGESHADVCIFTPVELRQLLAAVRPDMVPFVAIGAFAGLRTAEIQRLTWSEIGKDYVDVKAAKSKTRLRRIVPILPALAAWLEPRRGEGDVCPLAKPWGQLRAAAKACGFQWRDNALRHSFGTYRLAMVKSESQVALEMGNSPSMIFRHYRAIATEDAAREWFGVLPAGVAERA